MKLLILEIYPSDQNWQKIDSNIKEKINYTKRGDGEFWMSYQDFCREFEEVTICSLAPDLSYSSKGAMKKVGFNYINMYFSFLHVFIYSEGQFMPFQ